MPPISSSISPVATGRGGWVVVLLELTAPPSGLAAVMSDRGRGRGRGLGRRGVGLGAQPPWPWPEVSPVGVGQSPAWCGAAGPVWVVGLPAGGGDGGGGAPLVCVVWGG